MNVRCGSCRTQFEVAGAGRYACPVCGAVNVVRETAPSSVGGYPAAPGVAGEGMGQAPPPPPPPPPPPKLECPECGHEFFVGPIPLASCPNCGAEVETGLETPNEGGD